MKQITIFAFIIVAEILFGLNPARAEITDQPPANPTIQDIEHKLQRSGPDETVYWLTRGQGPDGETAWDYVLQQMNTGKSEWIALAPKLKSGTNQNASNKFPDVQAEILGPQAGESEELLMALVQALSKNPVAVLKIIGDKTFSIMDICGLPVDSTLVEVDLYFSKTKQALLKLDDPSLQSVKNSCLISLKKTYAAFTKAHKTEQ